MKLTETNLESVITSLQRKLEETDLSETNKTTIYNELEVKKLQLENVVQRQTPVSYTHLTLPTKRIV